MKFSQPDAGLLAAITGVFESAPAGGGDVVDESVVTPTNVSISRFLGPTYAGSLLEGTECSQGQSQSTIIESVSPDLINDLKGHGFSHIKDSFGHYFNHGNGVDIHDLKNTFAKHGAEYDGFECQDSRGRTPVHYFNHNTLDVHAFGKDGNHDSITGIQIGSKEKSTVSENITPEAAGHLAAAATGAAVVATVYGNRLATKIKEHLHLQRIKKRRADFEASQKQPVDS